MRQFKMDDLSSKLTKLTLGGKPVAGNVRVKRVKLTRKKQKKKVKRLMAVLLKRLDEIEKDLEKLS
jgi:hypothetical protein